MFLISQVESIGYLKNVDVNENLENSVSILFHIKSIKTAKLPSLYSQNYDLLTMAFLSRF